MGYLPVIYWQQGIPGQLGTCSGTSIAMYGCWLCSSAMNFQKQGYKDSTPQSLNARWTNGSPGYTQGCLGYAGLPPATYGGVRLVRQGYGLSAAQGVNPVTESATIGVNAMSTLGSPTHYLAFDHVSNGAVICGDPWVGDLCNVIQRYGNVTTVDVYTPGGSSGGSSGDDDLTPEQATQLSQILAWTAGTGNNTFYRTMDVYNWTAGTGNHTYYNTKELVDALHALQTRVSALEDDKNRQSGS